MARDFPVTCLQEPTNCPSLETHESSPGFPSQFVLRPVIILIFHVHIDQSKHTSLTS